MRFYCGAPLVASNGHRLGTLCFADVKPRKFDQASCMIMVGVAGEGSPGAWSWWLWQGRPSPAA